MQNNSPAAPELKFFCHSYILVYRSTYFKGCIKSAYLERKVDIKRQESIDGVVTGSSKYSYQINLPSAVYINEETIAAMLEYIYLDKVSIPTHKRKQLFQLAEHFCMTSLMELCSAYDPFEVRIIPLSTFKSDIRNLMNDSSTSDVVVEVCCNTEIFDTGNVEIYGHKAILSKISYFATIFDTTFKEGYSATVRHPEDTADVNQFGSLTSTLTVIHLKEIISDVPNPNTLLTLLKFAYTGELELANHPCSESLTDDLCGKVAFDKDESIDYPGLLVLADRLGFPELANYCERQLSLHLGDVFPDNALNVLNFAETFNFTKLQSQCLEILNDGNY